jgi:hypothetical protein
MEGATALLSFVYVKMQGRTQRGGGEVAARQHPPKSKLKKKTDFVDITISKVLRDLPFSRNQPLKSADDCTSEFFKNKLIKLKKNERTL